MGAINRSNVGSSKCYEGLKCYEEGLKTNQFNFHRDTHCLDAGNAHLNSEGGSISTADLLVLTG